MQIFHPRSEYHIFAQQKYIILIFIASSDKFQFSYPSALFFCSLFMMIRYAISSTVKVRIQVMG